MSTDARIDELRKKFEDNPRRYFAPLANELRKAGNLSEAIGLCREFLPKQPEHMSGYIVFGQALYESGDLSEARTVFEQALALDPENLKALRHLGDIAKWEGDTAGARRWYERVLEADPRNDDIAAQLATLATPVYVKSVVLEPEPEREPVAPTPASVFAPPLPSTPTAPPPFTPAFSMAPIGLGAIPTPDAALRAVDFDEINARLREPEMPPAGRVEAPAASADAPVVREPDLLDLDAIEAAGRDADDAGAPFVVAAFESAVVDDVLADPVAAAAEPEAAAAVSDDPFGFPGAGTDEVPFEEGLIAPEWPDTSALVARMATPRSVTPAFVAAMTPEAVAAFGLEPGDPLPTPAFDEDARLAGLAAPFDQAEALSTEIEATRSEEPQSGTAPEPEPEPVVVVDGESEDVVVVVDILAAMEAEVEVEVDVLASADMEAVDEIDEGEPEWIVAAAPVPSSFLEDELPWLAPAPERETDVDVDVDAVAEGEVESESEPEVTALFVVDRFEADDVDLESAPAEASFADVMPEVMHEEHNPAFVTETMGELLVSQGFTTRAVSVYQELVRRRPYDPVLTSRLDELQERLAAEAAPTTAAVPTPAVPTAAVPTPAFPTPAFPTPAFPTPAYGTPAFATPAMGTPAMGTPAFVASVTPPFTTPLSVTPISSSAVDDSAVDDSAVDDSAVEGSTVVEAQVEHVTARQRFARLASRRVPRRTPPRASVAVETPADGLASLFGSDAPMHDDLAARALADAFAPIDETTHFGGDLPFEEAMLGGVSRSPTPMRSATPIATAAVADAAGGPFSFDRFFPDPATSASPHDTPAHSSSSTPASEPAREIAPPTVSDDLAQFSAWLKGLGQS